MPAEGFAKHSSPSPSKGRFRGFPRSEFAGGARRGVREALITLPFQGEIQRSSTKRRNEHVPFAKRKGTRSSTARSQGMPSTATYNATTNHLPSAPNPDSIAMPATPQNLFQFAMDNSNDEFANPSDLAILLNAIGSAGKFISLRDQPPLALRDIFGSVGAANVTGDEQQKLDVIGDNVVAESLLATGIVCAMSSEENAGMIDCGNAAVTGEYVVVYDPVDGSKQHRRRRPDRHDIRHLPSPQRRRTRRRCGHPATRERDANRRLRPVRLIHNLLLHIR